MFASQFVFLSALARKLFENLSCAEKTWHNWSSDIRIANKFQANLEFVATFLFRNAHDGKYII